MISIIIPICNTEQYIAQYIRMTGWRIKKNTYNNIRNGRKNWSRLCGNGNATSHVNPEKPDVPLNKNDAFQKVQKRRVQEKR